MIKRSQRTTPVITSANDSSEHGGDSIADSVERSLSAHFDRAATQPHSSIYDQISSIINGTKSKYSSVDEAVNDMQERSGFAAHNKKSHPSYFEQKKVAQSQSSAETDDMPCLFHSNPKIRETFDNYITDTRGNVAVPAVIDRVRSIHRSDVDDDAVWDDDMLAEYVSNKCNDAKANNPDPTQTSGLGKMTNFNDSDIDISNTDALHALSPVKAGHGSLLEALATFDGAPKRS